MAARQLVEKGDIDYLVFDYLSEMTMGLLAKMRSKDPSQGYTPDFVSTIGPLLPLIAEKKIKVISNAGAMNSAALKKQIDELVAAKKVKLSTVCIEGDELSDRTDVLNSIQWSKTRPDQFLSCHAYLGAGPIVDALVQNADIVICGRHVDSANVLAPLIAEFGWSWGDFDRLAQGSLAGHLIECGAQCTGGNFTDWHLVPSPETIGYPIVECTSDGDFVVTKAEDTGGMVTVATVAEQLVYEIGDPRSYQLPDVICDFSHVELAEVAKNRVRVNGARGFRPGDQYKVCATYSDDYRVDATFYIAGYKCAAKARSVVDAISKKVRSILCENNLSWFSQFKVDFIGEQNGRQEPESCHELLVRISATHKDLTALNWLAREMAPSATCYAPGITTLLGGRPRPTPRIKLINGFVKKDQVLSTDEDFLQENTLGDVVGEVVAQETLTSVNKDDLRQTVPLVCLAYVRSGDKGNDVNIGVIARKPEYLAMIRHSLNHQKLASVFVSELGENGAEKIRSWDLPGINAINFLMQDGLQGGGLESLSLDPQGKAFAQRILQLPIAVDEKTALECVN